MSFSGWWWFIYLCVSWQITCEFINVTRWKIAICGEYMKSRLKVQPIVSFFRVIIVRLIHLLFSLPFCFWYEMSLFLFFFSLHSYYIRWAYFNRHALVEWLAILSTVSATLAETMNGLIGINHLRDIGWKRWLLYLVILMNLGPGIKNAQDKRATR